MNSLRLFVLAGFAACAVVPALWADVGTWGEFSAESIRASDIALARGTAAARLVRGNTEFTFTLAQSALEFDYVPAPFDFSGQSGIVYHVPKNRFRHWRAADIPQTNK